MNSTEPRDSPPPAAGTWTVWRQDDNGNRFIVAQHLGRDEAERLAAEFEARGHKQVNWVEAEANPGRVESEP